MSAIKGMNVLINLSNFIYFNHACFKFIHTLVTAGRLPSRVNALPVIISITIYACFLTPIKVQLNHNIQIKGAHSSLTDFVELMITR